MTSTTARELAELLGCTVTVHEYGGCEYIITSGTGEGFDYAYDAEVVDLSAGETAEGWDYTTWCNAHLGVDDIEIAVAYYMETGRLLGANGGARAVLTSEQSELLDIAREYR